MKRTCILALVFLITFTSAYSFAEDRSAQLGIRLGGNYNYLTRPTDPKGEPTLLYGSAFAGFGFNLGAEFIYPIGNLGSMPTSVSFGLMYARHSGTGYAKNEARAQEQTLTLSSNVLQVPILFTVKKQAGPINLIFGLGPEILFTLSSSSTVTYVNIEGTPPELKTFDPLHIGLTASTGISFNLADIEIPILLRATWDPMVEGSTRERLSNYDNFENPGQYQVAFDWQVSLLIGANFSL